ncbi:MAG TPA: copper-binding protein, partial [Pyrinomonadaceae bacterium]|nr:copper-binding protein [Pyrinomonadaceae bacterium]
MAILILLVGTFLCGCAPSPPDPNRGQRYELKGKIVSFDKAQQQVIVQHEAVPGFMEAMTMPFTLREDSAFEVMRAGDLIQATLVVDDERTRLENPIITQAIEGAASPAAPAGALTEPEPGAPIPDASLVNQD